MPLLRLEEVRLRYTRQQAFLLQIKEFHGALATHGPKYSRAFVRAFLRRDDEPCLQVVNMIDKLRKL